MLQHVAGIINHRVEEKRQSYTMKIGGSIPRYVVGDDQRLAQVITNLLSNAAKFTPEGGKISLEASLVKETDGVCEIKIVVEDTGIGISPEQQAKLFNAFVQADSGTSREFGGTGLGLVISRRIIEMMGGGITVESELGKGSRFIFTINALRGKGKGKTADGGHASRKSDVGSESAHEASGDGGAGEFRGKRMLLAEDIEINREILLYLLEPTGIAIDCAENGVEALEMVSGAPDRYDIVFMDMQMPRMDGLEATRRIRALPERARGRLPIVAMTANVFKSDIEDCLAAGMDDHLGKPLDIDKVIELLRQFLSQ
jgi:CheY-like chemotaxis protein